MWSQITFLLVIVAGAISTSISHQARTDGLGYGHAHGFIYGDAYTVNHGYRPTDNHGHQDHAWAYPSYKFSYSVYDPNTGDQKSQAEYRHGDLVKGSYSLAEPGVNMRSVRYSADDVYGFKAAVHHITIHQK